MVNQVKSETFNLPLCRKRLTHSRTFILILCFIQQNAHIVIMSSWMDSFSPWMC